MGPSDAGLDEPTIGQDHRQKELASVHHADADAGQTVVIVPRRRVRGGMQPEGGSYAGGQNLGGRRRQKHTHKS